jgi:hypothetical protein
MGIFDLVMLFYAEKFEYWMGNFFLSRIVLIGIQAMVYVPAYIYFGQSLRRRDKKQKEALLQKVD